MQKRVVVTGAGGFVAHHLVKRLKKEGYWVRAMDIKRPLFEESPADEFLCVDLSDTRQFERFNGGFEEVYHLAADMGGIGYISQDLLAVAMTNALIDANVLREAIRYGIKKLFFSSSACVYPLVLQEGIVPIQLEERLTWPANPEPGYGLEKLFTEKLCEYAQEAGKIETRVARFHNVYGPLGTYRGGREKSPAAICRKVAMAKEEDEIEVWGDGAQSRSYTYIDDCIEGIRKLMASDFPGPVNIGSDEAINIRKLVELVARIAGKKIKPKYDLSKPQGVYSRNSDNTLVKEKLGWAPSIKLSDGMAKTYEWIARQVKREDENEVEKN